MKFTIPKKALSHFKKADSILFEYTKNVSINREINPNHFDELVRSIIYQQISIKAGATIYDRLVNLCDITPENIINIDDKTLQQIGISFRKVSYIKDLAEKVISNEVNLDILSTLSNDNVVDMLIKVKGIGTWTAEMFLMFSLGRMDVNSLNDLGIRRGFENLYGIPASKETFSKYVEKWTPYNTIAAFYLWEASKK